MLLREALFELRVFELGACRRIEAAVDALRGIRELRLCIAVNTAPANECSVERLVEATEFRVDPANGKPRCLCAGKLVANRLPKY